MSSDLVRGVLMLSARGDYALYESMRRLAFKVSDWKPLSETLGLAIAEAERREEK